MNDLKAALRIVAWAAHGVAALVLALLCFQSPAMTLFCIVPGALIGCASVAAMRGRPVTLYCAFGALMGLAFWLGVSSVNQRDFIGLIILIVLAAGVVWMLQQPNWASVIFAGLMALLILGLSILQYRYRHQVSVVDAETIRRSFLTTLGVVSVGLLYLGHGFAEVLLQPSRRPRRKKRRKVDADLSEPEA